MEIISDIQSMRSWTRGQKNKQQRVVLVPTMGFLHEGHLSLIRIAKQQADKVIAVPKTTALKKCFIFPSTYLT